MPIHPLLASPRTPSGYTWTIASRISYAFAEAEERFGERDPSYFYAGHEFVDGNPGTWYPGNRHHIIIQLSKECINDFDRALYQLSHEVIHLLGPTTGCNANNLEEGLATWFSEEYCRRETGRTISAGMPCYQRASDLVQRMLRENPNCIKAMRREERSFRNITEQIVQNHCSFLSREEIAFLLESFVRSTPRTRTAFDASQ